MTDVLIYAALGAIAVIALAVGAGVIGRKK